MSLPSIVPRKATKLTTMSWDEIRTRLRQEINKRSDAVIWRVGAGSVARELKPASARLENGQGQKPALSTEPIPVPRFFFSPQELPSIINLLRERLPTQAQAILEQANAACEHKFDLLGYTQLDYGKFIDWHLDAASGKRAPRKAWYKIPFLDFAVTGDHKVIWELNRHQQLPVLAKAHLLTREERFLREALSEWQSWREQNPYPVGINWASSLEVAFRSLSWIWLDHLLESNMVMAKSFRSDLLGALALNGRHIERYLSTYWSPNTHLLGEAVALFFIGVLCPELQSAARWRELGWRIVLKQAERQVERDGTHFEGSIYYHVYALDFLLHARILAARNGIAIPGQLDRTIQRMMEALCGLAQTGPPPRIGDDDGGRVFDPHRNRGRRLLDPLAIGAALFDRPDFKAASGGLTEEVLWLLGPGGAERFDALPAVVRPPVSRSFPAGGFYVMASSPTAEGQRSGTGAGALELLAADEMRRQLVIRAGPLGSGYSGHAHSDCLSIHLAAAGDEWLVDPGTFKYISGAPDREAFRGTAAHNTLQVDGISQADPGGPFVWRSLPKVRVEHWIRGESFDLFAASHNGYQRLTQPVIHRRWVFHLKPRFWLVRDVAEGEGEHQLDIFWHFAPRLVPSYFAPGFTLAPAPQSGPRGQCEGIGIVPCEGHGWSQQIQRGYVSPAYGAQEPAAVISFGTCAILPAEISVVLDLLTNTTERTGSLAPLHGPESETARALQYRESGTLHLFFFGGSQPDWRLGTWKSDARFIYVSMDRGGQRYSLALCAGSYFEIAGERLISVRESVERYELIFTGGSRAVFTSDPDMPVICKFEALETALAQGPVSG